jgi:hypothetical protein
MLKKSNSLRYQHVAISSGKLGLKGFGCWVKEG